MPAEVVGKDVLKMTFVLRLSAHQELNNLDLPEFYARSLSLVVCSDARYAQVVFGI